MLEEGAPILYTRYTSLPTEGTVRCSDKAVEKLRHRS